MSRTVGKQFKKMIKDYKKAGGSTTETGPKAEKRRKANSKKQSGSER